MKFFRKLFKKKEKPVPAFRTYGGQAIMDLLDEVEVAQVIEKETDLAIKMNRQILQDLGANPREIQEVMSLSYDKESLTHSGIIKGKQIWIRCIPGGYELKIDTITIEDDVPRKKEMIDFIFDIRSAEFGLQDCVENIKKAVEQAKKKKIEIEQSELLKKAQYEAVHSFLINTP
ncbi:MAG: hypothetical protein V4686_01525 [Patescibacteria group bacterium]